MAIKIQNSTIIDDSRNIVNAGVTTVTSVSIGNTQVISSARQLQNIASLDATTTATIESAIANAPNTFTDLNVTGISTFINGPVFIGSGTSTGTVSQPLQVSGSAYVSGNLGIGRTNPSNKLEVLGTIQTISADTTSVGSFAISNAGLLDITSFKSTGGALRFVTANTSGTNIDRGRVDSSGNFIIGSTSATGTASQPLQVTGGGYFSQAVGIGTTNPGVAANRLSVANATGGTMFSLNDGGTTNRKELIFTLDTTNNTASIDSLQQGIAYRPLLLNTGGGLIGIGTTNPQSTLDVRGNINVTGIITTTGSGGVGIGSFLRLKPYLSEGGEIAFDYVNGNAGYYLDVSAGNVFRLANYDATGVFTVLTNSTERLRVSNAGNLGIGTNNPTVSLQLSRNASISNVGSGITLAGTVGSALTVAQFLYANTNTTYLRIKATRNATGSDWTTASTKLVNVTDVTEQGYIEYNPNGSLYGMAFGSGATEWARFLQSGNLGIGVTNPSQKFEVSGTSRFFTSGQGDVSITHSSLVSTIRGASTVQLALGANNSEAIRINTSGSVGIGTTNPTSKLSVVGDGNFTGVVTASSFSGNASSATYATNAGLSTNLKGGLVGNLVYQSATDITAFLSNGTSGFVLQSNGVGNAPSWVSAAPVSAITGLTIQEETSTVGTANAVNTLNFIGSNITATASGGISTITVSDNLVGTALSISGISTLGITTFTGAVSFGTSAYFGANDKIIFGDAQRLQIYHNNSDAYISNSNLGGELFIESNNIYLRPNTGLFIVDRASGDNIAVFATGADLYYNNVLRFETTGYGVTVYGGLQVSGIVTASQFSTGSGTLGFTTNTISGPSEIIIDPSPVGVGTTSGIVRIRGDLYVDGTQFVVNSSTIELADLRVGIATTVGTSVLLDGGGIGIGSANIIKTITWNHTAQALTSSEDWNLASGKQYEINNTPVLTSTTLGTTVVNSSLTSVGTLGQLNVTGVTTVGFITASNLYVAGVGTFLSSGLKIRNPANTFQYNITGDAIAADRTLNLPLITGTDTVATLGLTQTFTATNTFSGSVSFTGSNVTINPTVANGNFTLGNTAGTGTFIVGQSTATQTTNIQAGASGVGTTKTINLGTGGLSGSFTQINIGPTAGVGTITINSATNLGINSTRPTSKLDVVGDVRITGVVTATSFSGSGANLTGLVPNTVSTSSTTTPQFIGFLTTSSGVTTSILASSTLTFIPSSGSLGIGTTNPTSKLHIQGDVRITGVVTATTFNGQINAGVSTISVNSSSDALRITQTGTGNALVVEDSSNPDSNPFVVNASGQVGIGTTNPFAGTNNSGLDVVGSINPIIFSRNTDLTGNSQSEIWAADGDWFSVPSYKGVGLRNYSPAFTGNIFGNIPYASGGALAFQNKNYGLIYTNGGSPLIFATVSVEALRIDVSQRVGIGITTPTSKLHVVGDARIVGTVTATAFVGDGSGLTNLPGGGGESYWVQTSVGIHTLSNVGIGTTNPTSKLHVIGDVLVSGIVTANSFRGDGSQLTGVSGGVSISTNTTNSNLLIPYATSFGSTTGLGATSLLVYNPSGIGALGLGTTNPTATLHVQGTTRITGITSIRDVTIDKSIASPNATVPVAIIGVTTSGISTETNIDVVLLAKGTGATLAQIPDGTVTGGEKRGQYATDWQKQRLGSSRVASGNYSTIGGGYTNTASGLRATVAGGNDNVASGQDSAVCGGNDNITSSNYSFIGGGQVNRAQTNTHATVCGGFTNTASGQYSFVGGGGSNNATSSYSFVGGGFSNTASTGTAPTVAGGNNNNASGSYAFIGGGESHIANANHSVVLGGNAGTVRSIVGNFVFPACSQPISSTQGTTQSALLLLARQTTTAAATVLTSNQSAASTTNQVTLPNNSAYFFKGSVIAGVTGAGNTKAWEFRGAIKRGANAAATSIVGSVIKDVIASDAGASTWDIAITADTTNGAIAVTVTGAASTTIRWVCKIETTEMTY